MRAAPKRLAEALEAQSDRLLPCVHCGFCLPACPTYNRLGDENDSPRGRLHLMKAVVEGRLDVGSDAFQVHIDRCLGCRACEPVCPSGVEYGTLLEVAREAAAEARPPDWMTRALLIVIGSTLLRRLFFFGGRLVRASGLASAAVRRLGPDGSAAKLRLALAMLAATEAPRQGGGVSSDAEAPSALPAGRRPGSADETAAPASRGSVAILTGCVQEGLYGRINEATARTLDVNGYQVRTVTRQGCCGALHAHAGDLETARDLARRNMDAFEREAVELIVVNAAGCGAAMKEYHVLFEGHPQEERARAFSSRVRDVTELLAEAGPRTGATVRVSVAYDHPCHLLHAQGISSEPIQVLEAIPGVEVRVIAGADECCGGAGIYGMTHPDLGGRIGGDKVASVRAAGADLACTPNPGCMMQIGAGLRMEGGSGGVVHPVELLDRSYADAGYYE